jgi:hypothetical protein
LARAQYGQSGRVNTSMIGRAALGGQLAECAQVVGEFERRAPRRRDGDAC